MSISGSCLCNTVQFTVDRFTGPFEICHCNRCRKVSGAQGMPAIGCNTKDFHMKAGAEHIRQYFAPIIHNAPAFEVNFCELCGSPVPPANPVGEFMEIPAGLLDDDPGLRPDKHIFVEHLPAWDERHDQLPGLTRQNLAAHRTPTT